jgi:hypothetical protein
MEFDILLKELLELEDVPVTDVYTELTRAQMSILSGIKSDSENLGLQIEEIYDIVKDADSSSTELKVALKRENLLVSAIADMADLTTGLIRHMGEHGAVIAAKINEIIVSCGLEYVGFEGERLDPRLHTVVAAETDMSAPETVIRVACAGYSYRGKIIRKASVVISKGES